MSVALHLPNAGRQRLPLYDWQPSVTQHSSLSLNRIPTSSTNEVNGILGLVDRLVIQFADNYRLNFGPFLAGSCFCHSVLLGHPSHPSPRA